MISILVKHYKGKRARVQVSHTSMPTVLIAEYKKCSVTCWFICTVKGAQIRLHMKISKSRVRAIRVSSSFLILTTEENFATDVNKRA